MPVKSNKLKSNKIKEKKEAKSKKASKKKVKNQETALMSRKLWMGVDPRVIRVVGFFMILFSFYLLLAFTSFFVNWFDSNPGNIISKSLGLGYYFSDHAALVRNWTGNLGAFLAKWFVLNSFGIGGYFIALLVFAWGLKLMLKVKMFSNWSLFRIVLMGLLWLPMIFNLILPHHPDNIFRMDLEKPLLMDSINSLFPLCFKSLNVL